MTAPTVIVDVDQVCADLHSEWLRMYRMDYGHDLAHEDIVDWDIHLFVVPECGEGIYDYLELSYLYDGVQPIEGAVDAVRALRDAGYRVVFVTSSNPEAAGQKMRWLDRHGFLGPDGLYDVVVARDKSLIVADWIVDDAKHNISESSAPKRLLVDAPYNRDVAAMSIGALRVRDLPEAAEIIIREG